MSSFAFCPFCLCLSFTGEGAEVAKRGTPKTQIGTYIPTELYERLRAYSEATGVPITRIVEDALRNYLDDDDPDQMNRTLSRYDSYAGWDDSPAEREARLKLGPRLAELH